MKTYLPAILGMAIIWSGLSAQAATLTLGDPNSGGIDYAAYVTMNGTDGSAFESHVSAWSWDNVNAPGTGWTHTTSWVALTLTEGTYFTIRMEADANVPWPSGSDPDRLAQIDHMFPSFTIWGGLDNSSSADHVYNNRGEITWSSSLYLLGGVPGQTYFYENSTQNAAEMTVWLEAGTYTIALGSNADTTDTAVRQGFQATFSTVPEPGSGLLALLAVCGLAGLRRRK